MPRPDPISVREGIDDPLRFGSCFFSGIIPISRIFGAKSVPVSRSCKFLFQYQPDEKSGSLFCLWIRQSNGSKLYDIFIFEPRSPKKVSLSCRHNRDPKMIRVSRPLIIVFLTAHFPLAFQTGCAAGDLTFNQPISAPVDTSPKVY